MRFTVGGRQIDLTAEQVTRAMKGAVPEPIREHLVEINGTVYPPKQAFDAVTHFPRDTFTTMEAQRVLTRLGFVCRRAGDTPQGKAWIVDEGSPSPTDSSAARLTALEAAVATAQAAIAGLHSRVAYIEGRDNG